MTQVYKFGGTSLGSAERIAHVAGLARGFQGPLVLVASATGHTTDELVRIIATASTGRAVEALGLVATIRQRHSKMAAALGGDARVDAAVESLSDELGTLVEASVALGELTARVRDRILSTGEKLSVNLVALALRAAGRPAQPLYADAFLETDGVFGAADPLGAIASRHVVAALRPHLESGVVPVVTGFCGRGPDGATTTLGRGGSDLTATVLAGALGAESVVLWTDVDGVFSADPRVEPSARVIPQLNYREAAEMSFYGAKVLHQRTMIPVAPHGTPVWTRNTQRPEAPGTVVNGAFTPGSHPVKAVTAVRDHALVSVEGKGMAGVPGVAARVFSTLADRGISVTVICQSSSEASICLAVPTDHAGPAEQALKEAFATDISRGHVEEVVVRRGVGLVAAVGLGMAQTLGVAARLFSALARARVSVLAIAQGSSELNITAAVDEAQVPDAIRAIHGAFGLDRIDTGDETASLDLVLLGCGAIGRALVAQLRARHAQVVARFGLVPRVVGVADRSGWLLRPAGLSEGELDELLAAKAGGGRIAALDGACEGSATSLVESALAYRLGRPVLVDVSDADDARETFEAAFRLGADVATANKKPLAGPLPGYRALMAAAESAERILRAEATVGAGLPVVDTLEMLLHTGDRLTSAEGSLSGTLGFLMTRVGEGVAFSAAVEEAAGLGYTEPDPVADLSGADVARKALILGRISGLAPEAEVALEGLVPADWAGTPLPDLVARLRAEVDEKMAARVAAARGRGCELRFVARLEADRIEVGPAEVPADSALGALRGTDNLVVFRSERYSGRPLVVTGPGAGVEVTAMGVLGDILRIAAERG